jgi:hypothetical protein
MSMLGPEVHAELTELLGALQSSSNSMRSQAEELLNRNWVNNRPAVLLMGLAEQVEASTDLGIRSFAALLFRRIASKQRKDDQNNTNYTFLAIDKEQAAVIQQKLLQTLLSEPDKTVRNKISDAVAELARQYTEEEQTWPGLLATLFQLSNDEDADKRATAYRIFATTPGIIENNPEEAICQAFSKGFSDAVVSVRLRAMEAFSAFFRGLSKKRQLKFQSLIPEILSILPPVKESNDSEDLSIALVALIDLAGSAPKMFKPHFHDLVSFCVTVIQDKDLESLTRQNSLELLATFADYAPSMCRKEPTYTEQMITQCLSLMTDIGEDDDEGTEWLESDDLDQDESDYNHVAGEQTMDRLANRLGGSTILAPAFHWLPRMMTSLSWKDRHAALMAISAISEGCRELMLGELAQVLKLVIPALKDSHARVRWAGCNALGQMSTDFAPAMQEDHANDVLEALIPVLASPEARVKSHAAAALVNFCEEAKKSVLEPHLDNLLSHLFQLLQNDKRYVQEQALSTIATIADAAEAAFAKYYDTLMPMLLGVLQRDSDKENRLLRSKAMECATLIALAVGKERLGQDTMNLVKLLATIQNGIVDADDPQAQYLMHCWGRMCRVMTRDFVPFLPTVVPPLVDVASAKCDVALLDDEEEIERLSQEEGWELVPVRGKTIGIKTSSMDDKHMATELLVVYAQVLEGDFAPYVGDIMERIALPGLVFLFHDPVRVISAKLVPQLLNCCKKAYGMASPQIAALWTGTADRMLEVLKGEPSVDTLAEMFQSFYEAVEVLGENCLSGDHMNRFVEAVEVALKEYELRVQEREEERAGKTEEDAEDEAEELQLAIEDDQTLLSDMNKAMHTIFKHHGSSFLAAWERLMPVFEKYMAASDPTQRQWALCVMDDVVEYCGTDSSRYMSYISRPLILGCADESPPIRQAAAYGIGEAARCGGPAWGAFVAGAIPYLFNMTRLPAARDEENAFATENACVAIAKILKFNNAHVPDVAAVSGEWLSTLPVTNDEEGAPYAYAFLSELIVQ